MSDQKERFTKLGADIGKNEQVVEYYGDGTALTESGELTTHNYFDFLNIKLSDYSDLRYTKEELDSVRRHLRLLSTGSTAAVPLMCAGPKCPFAQVCPLQQMDRAPLGKQCIPENEFLTLKRRQYIQEYEVQPDQPSLMALVNELAEIDIYEMRTTWTLAKEQNAELFIDEVTMITENGQEISQKKVHPAFDLRERLKNRRTKLMEILVATPKERYKREAALKRRDSDDYSTTLTEIQSTLQRLQKQTNNIAFKKAKPVNQISDGVQDAEIKDEAVDVDAD